MEDYSTRFTKLFVIPNQLIHFTACIDFACSIEWQVLVGGSLLSSLSVPELKL